MVKPFGIEPVGDSSRCSECGKVANVEALFGLDNLIMVKHYCHSCLDDAEYALPGTAAVRFVHRQ